MIAPIIALKLATIVPLLKRIINNEGVDHEDQPDDSLRQAHRSVLVIVPATLAICIVCVLLVRPA